MSRPYTIRHGSEGPRHDPYAFTEYTMGDTTLHMGLAEWIETPGYRRGQPTLTAAELRAMFLERTGYTPTQLERFERRREEAKRRQGCTKCGCRETEDHSGYPGETLTVCAQCGAIVDSHVNMSSIE